MLNTAVTRALPFVSLTLLLAACSPTPSSPVVTPATKSPVTLTTASSAQFGQYVADSAGTSVYLFTKDTRGVGVSTCTEVCAATWSALTFDPGKESLSTAAGGNLSSALLGSFVRADNGKTQATYNGWPLYRFSKDLKPGDTNGENVGGTWFLVKPDGSRNLPPTPAPITFTTTLSSANEVPAVAVASSGSAAISSTLDGNKLTVSGTFKNLSGAATLAHIHGPGDAKTAAPVLFALTFTNDATGGSGTLSGSVDLSADQLTQLKAGLLYFNVHTAANKSGEIRGQIVLPGSTPAPTPDPAPVPYTIALSSASEVPAVTAASNGSGSVTATFDGMNLIIKGTFKNLTGPATLAHLHGPASRTAAAPVLFPLTFTNDAAAGSGTLSGTVMLMGDQVTALKDGQLYINIHTAANKAGEIRGQIETSGGGY